MVVLNPRADGSMSPKYTGSAQNSWNVKKELTMSKLKIKTKERRFEPAGDLYGIFFEDINRAGDGGLYPEMLRNRSFEDSVLPEGYIQQ